MERDAYFSETRTSKIGKKITDEDIETMISKLGEEIELNLMSVLKDIQNNKIRSYAVSKDEPDTSIFFYGGKSDIIIKIETKQKQAEFSLSRSFDLTK